MDFLNRGKKEKNEKTKESKPESGVAQEIKEASGHSNLKDVSESWDAGKRSESAGSTRATGGRTRSAGSGKRPDPAEQQKAKELEEAFSQVGEGMMMELANIPYDVWAWLANDPTLSLTSEESKKLANAYYTMAKAIKPDINKPSYMFLYILVLNGKMTFQRLRVQAAKKAEEEKKIVEGEVVAPKPN